MPKLIERPVGISQEDVMKAPPLVSRKFFMDATGINHKVFYAMAESGDIKQFPVGSGRHKYYKSDIMRICGYKEKQNGHH